LIDFLSSFSSYYFRRRILSISRNSRRSSAVQSCAKVMEVAAYRHGSCHNFFYRHDFMEVAAPTPRFG
jgi:hypothetical protein